MQIGASKYWAYIIKNIQNIIFASVVTFFICLCISVFLYQFVIQFFCHTFSGFTCSYFQPKCFCVFQIISFLFVIILKSLIPWLLYMSLVNSSNCFLFTSNLNSLCIGCSISDLFSSDNGFTSVLTGFSIESF